MATKSETPKKRKRVEPCVRLAMRLIILCYQHFDLMARRPIDLSYIGYTQSFKTHIRQGDLTDELTKWIWMILSSRQRRSWETREQDPLWFTAKAQAERFIEENRQLIAEEELST